MAVACLLAVATANAMSFGFRLGLPKDVLPIALTLARQMMNPLSIQHERFVVATTDKGRRVGFGQIRPLDGDLWELASLYVEEDARSSGIGRALVAELLARHANACRPLDGIHLITLATTVAWYEDRGFELCKDAPDAMGLEIAAGKAISLVLGNELVCMRYAQG